MADKSKSSRKVKDKWKEKTWFKIYAPEMFNSIELGETPAATPDELRERITEATVQDLTGDFSKMHIKLRFKANNVKGSEVHTQFIGHDLTNDYVRRLTRRKRTKTEHVVDAITKDGYRIRVKPMVVTERRIQSSQETSLRNTMVSVVRSQAATMLLSEVIKAIVSGDMARDISNATKVIIPMKKVEIRKSEVIAFPSESQAFTQVQPAAETEEPAAPEEAAEVKEVQQPVAEPEEQARAEEELSPEEIGDSNRTDE